MLMDFSAWLAICYMAFAVAAVSHTIAKAHITKSFRQWARSESTIMGDIMSCPWCLSHWVSLCLVTAYKPVVLKLYMPLDLIVSLFVMVAISAIIEGIISVLKALTH